jgi:hypothetical protein
LITVPSGSLEQAASAVSNAAAPITEINRDGRRDTPVGRLIITDPPSVEHFRYGACHI